MGFFNKLKWVLGILIVFVLIISTNLIDRNNFVTVRDSVVTIYEDRLIAKNLIFEMSKSVQEKEIAMVASDSIFYSAMNAKVNKNIEGFIRSFEHTKLTSEERIVFKELKNNLETLNGLEIAFVDSGFQQHTKLANHISDIKENLYDLSEIQLNEGRKQMSISKKAIDTVELFTQIEIYILVFLAIIIQIIVMYKPKEKEE